MRSSLGVEQLIVFVMDGRGCALKFRFSCIILEYRIAIVVLVF